jgi:hypothetical protein
MFKHIPTLTLILSQAAQLVAAPVSIPFTVPKDGRVSLAIYDKEGRIVRTLLTGKPLAKGQHSASWDGLDRYGNAPPAGDFGRRPPAITNRQMRPRSMPPAFTGKARSTKGGIGV